MKRVEKREIKTVKDIVLAVTHENKERFLKDFVLFLNMSIDFKNGCLHNLEVISESFVWTDNDINTVNSVIVDYGEKIITYEREDKGSNDSKPN